MSDISKTQTMANAMASEAKRLLANPGEQTIRRDDGISVETFRVPGLMLLQPKPEPGDAIALIEAITALSNAMVERGGAAIRINDGLGHSRPVYAPFMLSIVQRAFFLHQEHLDASERKACRDAMGSIMYRLDLPMLYDTPDTALTLWKAVCWLRHDLEVCNADEAAGTRTLVDAITMTPGKDDALHPFNESEQLLDTWWYNELCGLHALGNLAMMSNSKKWLQRVAQIANHHLMNIQADHATSQPWGLAAFVLQPETTIFAEQQLHEAAAGVRSPFAKSNTLTALLLADAASHLQRYVLPKPHTGH